MWWEEWIGIKTVLRVYVYDPSGDTWTSSIPSMQSERSHLGVAVLNGRIYAVGGSIGREISLQEKCWI